MTTCAVSSFTRPVHATCLRLRAAMACAPCSRMPWSRPGKASSPSRRSCAWCLPSNRTEGAVMIAEPQVHRIDLETILKVATEKNATDIHLQAGLPPILRIQKKLVALGTEKLSPERVEELMFPIMTDRQKVLFKQNMEEDFSYGIKELARFRINVFRP